MCAAPHDEIGSPNRDGGLRHIEATIAAPCRHTAVSRRCFAQGRRRFEPPPHVCALFRFVTVDRFGIKRGSWYVTRPHEHRSGCGALPSGIFRGSQRASIGSSCTTARVTPESGLPGHVSCHGRTGRSGWVAPCAVPTMPSTSRGGAFWPSRRGTKVRRRETLGSLPMGGKLPWATIALRLLLPWCFPWSGWLNYGLPCEPNFRRSTGWPRIARQRSTAPTPAGGGSRNRVAPTAAI